MVDDTVHLVGQVIVKQAGPTVSGWKEEPKIRVPSIILSRQRENVDKNSDDEKWKVRREKLEMIIARISDNVDFFADRDKLLRKHAN